MKSLFTVISFTIKDMVKRKSFIISNIIILLIIVVGFNVISWLSNSDQTLEAVTVLDNQNIFEGRLDNLHEQFASLGYDINVDKESTQDDIKAKIESEEDLYNAYKTCIEKGKKVDKGTTITIYVGTVKEDPEDGNEEEKPNTNTEKPNSNTDATKPGGTTNDVEGGTTQTPEE